jgi:hypothetical protein
MDYAASKSALMYGFTKSLAQFGASHNIRAVCVSPGPVLTRAAMANMQTLLGRAAEPQEIIDLVLIKSVDILKIGQAIGAKGYEIVSWCCGTDRFNDYSKMCKKYTPSVEVIEIKRDESSISATQVRDAILKDKEDIFKELTPQELHKSYERFKSSLEALD